MKFLVLGANGMAGHLISLYLYEKGYDVTGLARENKLIIPNMIIGDVTNETLIKSTIEDGNYDIVINCIGILNKEAENNIFKAAQINGALPHLLVKLTKNMKTRIIHLSTDCVFAGKENQAYYTESSIPDGKTFYDISKAWGEIKDDKNLTLRNSIIGPDIKESGIGLLNWFMKQQNIVSGYKYAIWTGQTTLQLAKTIEKASKEKVTGLINMVPEISISKYDLLSLMNQYLRKNPILIQSDTSFKLDKTLVRTNLEWNYKIPTYEKQIKELGEWMRGHKDLYPHYSIV